MNPIKESKYSTRLQIFKQPDSSCGIDTYRNTNFGNFYFIYNLTSESEARFIEDLPYINFHLTKLEGEKAISRHFVSGKIQLSRDFSKTFDYENYKKGAKFIPLEAKIIIQK